MSALLIPAVMVRLRCGLPVHAVEGPHLERGKVDALDAAHVERPAVRVEPRAQERMDAAMPAEIVLRRPRIELVEDEIPFAAQDAKVGFARRMPQRSLAAADGAVAIDNVVELRFCLEGHAAAVAGATQHL